MDTRSERFLSANPHFVKSALSRYTAADFVAMVDRHNIAWHEKTLGQLFCDGSAKEIVAMLLAECAQGDVAIELGAPVHAVSQTKGRYEVKFDHQIATAPALVIATGGPSIPKMGASGFAYDLARQFDLKVVDPKPALVPLTLGSDEILFRELSGVSTDVIAKTNKTAFREAALFTHKGLSGPAILQISSYWQHGQPIFINFLPNADAGWLLDAKKAKPRSGLKAVLPFPDRLAAALANRIGLSETLGNTPDRKLVEIEQLLANWSFNPSGTEGYAKAEVTVGGVSTDELSSKTMEVKSQNGLYFIGEAVDVTGWLGGYNFQWAWTSGWVAGEEM